ncbi:hypothetical protein Xinn_02923 [Xenorhabdus innexi]|uniref:Uncharacterized protein n=1 Tax=Xenorhabdus innexi TaxID=290109 RepID=A0A2G0N904_9GAMM|nr:hypothetical protein Xinn_02923 [Xenorhabdus innexi]
MNFLDKKELVQKTKLSMSQVDGLKKAGLFPARFHRRPHHPVIFSLTQ